MEQLKYLKIQRIMEKNMDAFRKNDHIIVEEKLDGSNFSIRYDEETGTVAAFGHHKMLSEKNKMRGAYQWAEALDPEKIKNVLGKDLIAFGEWMAPHVVVYPQEVYYRPYFFDVYNVSEDAFLTQKEAMQLIEELGFDYVPVLFEGTFESWNKLKQYVGMTKMGGSKGEGIVIKNMTQLNLPHVSFYIKIVRDDFKEVKDISASKTLELDKKQNRYNQVHSVVTAARIRKIIFKMIDENLISEKLTEQDEQVIEKQINALVIKDCLSEENEIMKELGKNFGKIAVWVIRDELPEVLAEIRNK